MAGSLLMCLILVEALVGLAMASEKNVQTLVQSNSVGAPSTNRKLGNHGPSMAPSYDQEGERSAHGIGSSSSSGGETSPVFDLEHRHHRSVDKSVAGGGVILGGLATMFLLAVFCYIRATGRDHKSETSSNA
ncbi:unnamed protein product [Linum tenue]|uniref:Transmembrane protein n=1 Tax=Linum tenue TaxID=586396 RepID=A0AAV0PLR5_9ROSI|nr:unnamed protein product [Linum tenue]